MKTIIAEFRETAHSCRTVAELIDIATQADLRRAQRQEALESAAESLDAVRKELTERTVHQLEAILDREHDPKVAEKRDEIVELLDEGPSQLLEHLEEDDSEEDEEVDELTRELIVWSTLLSEIARGLEYIAASWAARPKSNTVHHTNITGSTVGGIAIGDESRARGSVGTAARKRRSK